MEPPPRTSAFESIVYAPQPGEDDTKFLENYLAQRLPASHLDITNASYLRNLGNLGYQATPSNVASFLNAARQQPLGLSLLQSEQHYSSPWPQALNHLAWARTSDAAALRDPAASLPLSYAPPPAATASNGSLGKRPHESRGQTESRVGDDDDDSPSPTEGTDAPPSKRKAMSLQEKNRKAQKRFREKQKVKMSTLEQQNDVMSMQLGTLRVDNDNLRNRNSVLEKVLKLRDEQIAVLQEKVKLFEAKEEHNKGRMQAETAAATEPLMGGASVMEDERYPADQVSKMTADEVIGAWKDYLKQLSSWVVQAETSSPDPEVIAKVEAIISEAGSMCTRVAILNPVCIKKLVSCNLENQEAGGAQPGHWKVVLNALAMTPDQKREAIAARQVFLQKLKVVTDERTLIHAKLQSAVPKEAESNNQTTGASLQAHDAMVQLKENLRKEHNIHWEFNAGLFGKVMSKLQVAKAAVHSYPFYPDALGIANVIAEEMGKTDEPAIDVP